MKIAAPAAFVAGVAFFCLIAANATSTEPTATDVPTPEPTSITLTTPEPVEPTATPTPTPTPVETIDPEPEEPATPAPTPEPIDLCTNIDGLQESIPEGYESAEIDNQNGDPVQVCNPADVATPPDKEPNPADPLTNPDYYLYWINVGEMMDALTTPCATEDSHNCFWDAANVGNGLGENYTDINGVYYTWDQLPLIPSYTEVDPNFPQSAP